jgi:hypothetical protein
MAGHSKADMSLRYTRTDMDHQDTAARDFQIGGSEWRD